MAKENCMMDCSTDVFFTEAAFEQYAVQPTFLELLEKYAPKQTNLAKTRKEEKVIRYVQLNNQWPFWVHCPPRVSI